MHVSLPANAAWELVDKADGRSLYVDTKSITKRGSVVGATVKVTSDTGSPSTSSVSFDCRNHEGTVDGRPIDMEPDRARGVLFERVCTMAGHPFQFGSEPSPIVTASRMFAGPKEYPPKEFAAYGILAFRSRSSPHDRERHLIFCNAYVATFPHADELELPRSKQMVTVWPVSSDDYSHTLNRLKNHLKDTCQIAVDNYGLVIAQQAIKDAELTGRTGSTLSRAGPFLLAWSPSADKGTQDALVLVSDLSDITTYEQAHERFLACPEILKATLPYG